MLSKCHLLLLSLVVVFLLPLFAVAETTNIVMVDVSGSMAGYGYHSQNIMPKARRQLNDFVNFTQSNGHKIKIIQFASNIYETNCPNLINIKPCCFHKSKYRRVETISFLSLMVRTTRTLRLTTCAQN